MIAEYKLTDIVEYDGFGLRVSYSHTPNLPQGVVLSLRFVKQNGASVFISPSIFRAPVRSEDFEPLIKEFTSEGMSEASAEHLHKKLLDKLKQMSTTSIGLEAPNFFEPSPI